MTALQNTWVLREVYFDEEGNPTMHREQPKVEPVAYIGMIDEDHFADVCRKAGGNSNTPLYTTPQPAKREPLIADEICDSWEFITGHQIQFGPSSEGRSMYLSTDEVIEFARAIERAHGIGEKE